jgi:hypothetical protein
MFFNSETFAAYLRDLISHLESNNVEQAEVHIGDAIEFLERVQAQPADATTFDPHKLRVTMIALGKSRIALENGQLKVALANAKDALAGWA